MKQRMRSILIGIAVLGIAAACRFTGLDWDQGNHLHPDERFILMTIDKLQFPADMNPHFFAYGSFPLYLLKAVGAVAGNIHPSFAGYDRIYLIGRILSGLFDIGSLVCIWYLLKHLTKRNSTVWLGTLWYALSVLPIQLSHFYAVDTMLTFFSCVTLFFCLRYHQHPSARYAIGIGIAVGLALATKVSASVLFVPIGVTCLLNLKQNWKKTCLNGLSIAVTALYTFFVFEPYAFFDFITFKTQLLAQQAMTKSAFTFPYTLQYVGKIPYFYEFKNMLLWGQGLLLGLLSVAGILRATKMLLKKGFSSYLILLSFFWIYTLTVGKFAIGFMRYMLPVYPILTVFAALLIQKCTQALSQKKRMLIYGLLTVIIALWTGTFMTIYNHPNTRVVATDWIQNNIPAGTGIALEHWDDAIPIGFASLYTVHELPLYDPDTKEKWNKINQALAETEYIIIASNRLYTPLMKMTNCSKLPQGRCYKTTAEYYKKLFGGTLGFTEVATFTNYPTLPLTKLQIDDGAADESFTVYDHPKIMIFKKTGMFTPIDLEE